LRAPTITSSSETFLMVDIVIAPSERLVQTLYKL
jgi:hypothetical protein